MHATHQFFLTERSLYLLVVDDRRENPNFYYWLNVIRVLTDNSPVLVIQNEKNNNKCSVNEGELRKEFHNLEKFFNLNFATDRSKLEDLQHHIQHRITQLPQVRENWPKSWVNIRHALENYAQNQNYISLEEYKTICRNNGITEVAEMLQISKALHELGICLHFQKITALKHQIILKPAWVTNAVYKVVKNNDIIANNGCFTAENLKALWSNPEYAEVQGELLLLMQEFNLCYPLLGRTDTYIAPQLLPHSPPENINIDFTDNLTLTYRYEFMPKGLIAPFIVGMYRLIAHDQRFVWKNGVILHDGNAYAEVIESDYNREIQIRVTGFSKRSLLDRIRQKFWEIHASFDDRLNYEELIPCNCSQCKVSPIEMRETYDLAFLMDRLRKNTKQTVECRKSTKDVNIRNLISDFPEINLTQNLEFSRKEGHFEIPNATSSIANSQGIPSLNIQLINQYQAKEVTDQSQKTQNFNAPMSGVIASDKALVTKNTFTQINNANTAELLQLIAAMRQTAAQFPQEIQDDIIIDIDDVEAEITKPAADRNFNKLKKRLTALVTTVALIAAPIAGITDFANNAIDLAGKLGIELQLPPMP